jgi:NADH-quinone oxidoreductase subunit N
VLVAVAMFFKIAAVPFHFWAPDVYEGSPNHATAIMATLAKVAYFAGFYRLFSPAMLQQTQGFYETLTVIIILTLLVSNVLALQQTNVKRMLAYSGISHAGYMLLAFFGHNDGVLFYYAVAYSASGLLGFALLIFLYQKYGMQNLVDFNGLASAHPFLAVAFTIALLSMAGIPVFAGFFAKYLMLTQALQARQFVLLATAIIASVVSLGYYFRLILAMYTQPWQRETKPENDWTVLAIVLLCLIGVVGLGVWPQAVLGFF